VSLRPWLSSCTSDNPTYLLPFLGVAKTLGVLAVVVALIAKEQPIQFIEVAPDGIPASRIVHRGLYASQVLTDLQGLRKLRAAPHEGTRCV